MTIAKAVRGRGARPLGNDTTGRENASVIMFVPKGLCRQRYGLDIECAPIGCSLELAAGDGCAHLYTKPIQKLALMFT